MKSRLVPVVIGYDKHVAKRTSESYQDSPLERSSLSGCHGSPIYFGQHSLLFSCDKRGDHSVRSGGRKYLLRKGVRDWRGSICTKLLDLPQCIWEFDICPDRSVSSAPGVWKVIIAPLENDCGSGHGS